MTDVLALAEKLMHRVEWQNVPETVALEDLVEFIKDAIRYLYVMTGRAMMFSEDMFIDDPETDPPSYKFSVDLPLDEREYVIVTAHLNFIDKVKQSVDDMTSYSTDAMTVTQGDKPFANMDNMSKALSREQDRIWYKMIRYHL